MAIETALQGRSEEKTEETDPLEEKVIKAKKRMLEWDNPVEYVNNMYGCHPDDKGNEYFQTIYGESGGLDKENE